MNKSEPGYPEWLIKHRAYQRKRKAHLAAYLEIWKRKNPEKHLANYERWTMKKKMAMYSEVVAERLVAKAGK